MAASMDEFRERYKRVNTDPLSGRMGSRFKVLDKQTQEILLCDRTFFTDKNIYKLRREIGILQELSAHPNIIKYYDSFQSLDLSYLITDSPEGSVSNYLCSVEGANEHVHPEKVQSYTYQLCCGLAFMHSHGYLHRNLSLSRLALFNDGTKLKVTGFGDARRLPAHDDDESSQRHLTLQVGALTNRAPEMLLGSTSYDTAVDMWAVGLLFQTMATGTIMFVTDDPLEDFGEIGLLFSMFMTLGTPTEATWPGLTNLPHYNADTFPIWPKQPFAKLTRKVLNEDGLHLLNQFLTFDPSKRTTASLALTHPYFKSLDMFTSLALTHSYFRSLDVMSTIDGPHGD